MISIRERLLSGEDFDQLAAEFSDDPGSKQEGGKLGWAGEGKYTEAFEEVMMRSNLNEVSLLFAPTLDGIFWRLLVQELKTRQMKELQIKHLIIFTVENLRKNLNLIYKNFELKRSLK